MTPDLPSHVLRIKTRPRDPYVQLITNPDALTSPEGLRTSIDPVLLRVREYIRSVLTGDGKRPHCPFVQFIENQNGYRVLDVPEHPKEIDFAPLILGLADTLQNVSPALTSADQEPDPTTIVAAFSHPDAHSAEFCRRLDEIRDAGRQIFLDRGQMLAQMHPFHRLGSSSTKKADDPGDDPLYTSTIPLLMVRRMHKEDVVFMHNHEAMHAYRKYFS